MADDIDFEALSLIAYHCSSEHLDDTGDNRNPKTVFEHEVLPTLDKYTRTELLVLAGYLCFWGLNDVDTFDLVVMYADDSIRSDRPSPIEWVRQLYAHRDAFLAGNYKPIPNNFH
jgi:hypothetical protein